MKPLLPPSFFLSDQDQDEEALGSIEPESEAPAYTKAGHLKPKFRRGIYLLPNSLTIAGLFAGFYAIVAAMKGIFDRAAIAIFVAMIMDFLDGRVARLTHTESAFGTELDSLSDMVSFGITPALVLYSWSLYALGQLGWLAAFIFAAASALRLARFNTRIIKSIDKHYFQGLPIPAAAGILTSFVWACVEFEFSGPILAIPTACLTVLSGILMVSNLRYPSFKQVDLKGRVPFVSIITVVLILVGIAIDPPKVLFLVFSIYALSGPAATRQARCYRSPIPKLETITPLEDQEKVGGVN